MVVTEVTFKQKFEDLDFCEVTIDNFDTYHCFGNYTELLTFVGKKVKFGVRLDIVNGIRCNVMTDVCEIRKPEVQVSMTDIPTDGVDDVKSIIPADSKLSSVIDFDSKSLKQGDAEKSRTVYVYDVREGVSNISRWKDIKCLDCNSVSFNLRLFSKDSNLDAVCEKMIGKYILVDIKNTQYGLQVVDGSPIYIQNDIKVEIPNEVNVVSMSLRRISDMDDELKEFENKYDMINRLRNIVYFEPGYNLIEMFIEIRLISTICKIFGSYNRKLLYRAVFASRAYLIGEKLELSNPIVNYHRLITSALKHDSELIKLLDVMNIDNEENINKTLYYNIRRMATNLIKERRGISEESIICDAITSIDNTYGRLFRREIG